METKTELTFDSFKNEYVQHFIFKTINRPNWQDHLWCMWDMYNDFLSDNPDMTIKQFVEFPEWDQAYEIQGMQLKLQSQ